MDVFYKPGFSVYKNGEDPVWVTPHSGPAFETPTSRDENTDTVTSLCWMVTGGVMIVSNLPRKRLLGVDLNRDPPSKTNAIKFYPKFIEDKEKSALFDYRKKYAWAAKDEADHKERLRMYKDFWKTIKRQGDLIIFMHRKFTRIKNYPSIMDIITYGGSGIDMEVVKAALRKVNRKYSPFFRQITPHYRNAIIAEEKRVIDRIKSIFGEFGPDKISAEYRANIMNDVEMIKRFADRPVVRRLERHFTEKNFLSALRNALKRGRPLVTMETIFKGGPAIKQKKPLFKKTVLEIESDSFVNYWYPNETSNIILELLKIIRSRQ